MVGNRKGSRTSGTPNTKGCWGHNSTSEPHGCPGGLYIYSLTSNSKKVMGTVSISMTYCPTGRGTIVSCYLSIAEWSVTGRTVRHY